MITKLIGAPPLTEAHKIKRIDFAKKHLMWREEWANIIFTDEKKFNLDGSDGYKCYWHNPDKEALNFSKR